MMIFRQRLGAWFPALMLFSFFAFTRFWGLGDRAPHHDESINAWLVSEMSSLGDYQYKPSQFHGPLLFWLGYTVESSDSTNLFSLRIFPALFSLLTLLLLWFWGREQKIPRLWVMIAFYGISPLVMYYSRMAIHESLLVFFQLLWFLGLIDFLKKASFRSIVFFWVGLGGSILLKETFAISILALVFALIIVKGFFSTRDESQPHFLKDRLPPQLRKTFIAMGALTLTMVFLLYLQATASFESSGLSFHSLTEWIRGPFEWKNLGWQGQGQIKPWYQWWAWTIPWEIPSILMIVFSLFHFRKGDPLFKLTVLFAGFQIFIYSFIPYKTPWCFLCMQWPWFISFFIGPWKKFFIEAKSSPQLLFARWSPALIVFLFGFQFFWSYRLNFQFPLPDHPYVFFQTEQEIFRWAQNLEETSTGKRIRILARDPWPLPWLLRRFNEVDYEDDPHPPLSKIDVWVVEEFQKTKIPEGDWKVTNLPLRKGRPSLWIYERKNKTQATFLRGETLREIVSRMRVSRATDFSAN